ncbi:MAG: cupin domain-containing protein [Steroidobacteraceae bacterium]
MTSPPEQVRQLMQKDLTDVPGMEVRLLTVEYLPGGASLPHRHNAQVFVYVLSGTVRMQVQGGPVMTLGPGQTFYEGKDDTHTVSANASRTRPAKILVFMVRNKDASNGDAGEKK